MNNKVGYSFRIAIRSVFLALSKTSCQQVGQKTTHNDYVRRYFQ